MVLFRLVLPLLLFFSPVLAADDAATSSKQSNPHGTSHDPLQMKSAAAVEARAVLPSQVIFHSIFDDLPGNPSARDYPSILLRIRDLCDRHPGSEAAYSAIFAVEQWSAKKHITPEQAAPLIALRAAFNPAREELALLEEKADRAVKSHDFELLREVSLRLSDIQRQYPNTVSEFVAMGNLGPAYDQLGDSRLAQEMAREFLRRFPPTKTDYPSADHYAFLNLSLQAKLLGRSESVEAGIEEYRRISNLFDGRSTFAIPALFAAASKAAESGRFDVAMECFNEVVGKYKPSDDSRVVLARFRIAELLAQQGDKELALTHADALVKEFSGDPHWSVQATRLRDFVQTGGVEAPETGEVPQQPLTSSRWPHFGWFLLAVNVVVLLVVVAVLVRRSRVSRGSR